MTARTLGEANLSLLEELFEPLIANPFFIKDSGLRYVAVNRAMLELCGLRYKSEMIGLTAGAMYPPHEAQRYEFDERRVLRGAEIVDRVEEVRAIRRSPTWLILNYRPLRNADGTIVGVIGVSRYARQNFLTDRSYDSFARALDYIRDTFDKPLDSKKMAEHAGASVSQLQREFRKALNVTPRLYQQRVRIEVALQMMPKDLTISEIAHLTGFADHSSFSRRFKILTGLTPSEYRIEVSPAR